MEPLPDREQAVLRTLGEPGAVVPFQGIRRTLGLHPEILSRTLRRLERSGYIERTEGGYRLGARAVPLEEEPDLPGVEVLEARLPPGTTAGAVAESLQGRWVGPLRWQGLRDNGARLQWASPDGGFRVDLRLDAENLVIEVFAREGAWGEAVRAAYLLFGQVARGPGEPV